MVASGFWSAMASVLPPGAAQQSRICSWLAPTRAAISCEASSWMTTWALRKDCVFVTSPELTRRAWDRRLPGDREIPSAASSDSASGVRRRRVVAGIV